MNEDFEVIEGSEEAEKVQQLAEGYKNLLSVIDEDVDRQGLLKTPQRAAKAMWFFTKGYRQNVAGQCSRVSKDKRDSVCGKSSLCPGVE